MLLIGDTDLRSFISPYHTLGSHTLQLPLADPQDLDVASFFSPSSRLLGEVLTNVSGDSESPKCYVIQQFCALNAGACLGVIYLCIALGTNRGRVVR